MQTISFILKKNFREFPGDLVVRTVLSVPGAQVQPLVWEPRSCKPRGKAKKKKPEFYRQLVKSCCLTQEAQARRVG